MRPEHPKDSQRQLIFMLLAIFFAGITLKHFEAVPKVRELAELIGRTRAARQAS